MQSHAARFSSGFSEDPSVSSGSWTTHTALFSPHSELLSEEQRTKRLISDLFFCFPSSLLVTLSHVTGEKASTVLWKFSKTGEIIKS